MTTTHAFLWESSVTARRSVLHGRSSRAWHLQERESRRGLSWRLFFLGLFLLVVVAAGGFVYIREITSTAASGYDVSHLERRAAELRTEEQRLQLEAAEFNSLKRIEERIKTLNLVPVSAVAYTSPIVSGVVTGYIPAGTARR